MVIRTLTEKDAAPYWRLRLEGLQTEPFAFGKAAEEHLATSVEATAARFREMPPDFTMGAFEGENLIGMPLSSESRVKKRDTRAAFMACT